MKRRVIPFILILLTFTVFSSFFWDKFFEPNYEKIADGITYQVIKKIHHEKGLVPMGTGGGMLGNIYMMAISFKYKQEVDIPTARELLVYCVEEYLDAINANEQVRPFLRNYPFTPKNIEIRIFISTPQNGDVPFGLLCDASSIKGRVEYDVTNGTTKRLDTVCEESYEKAFQLVQMHNAKK